jgi:uncharacterized protein YbcV (DUF1398 family)
MNFWKYKSAIILVGLFEWDIDPLQETGQYKHKKKTQIYIQNGHELMSHSYEQSKTI